MRKEEIKKSRKLLFNDCDKVTIIKKGDKRPTHSSRLCGVCGRKLTNMSRVDGKVITIVNHYTLDFGGFIKYYLCQDIKSCYANILKPKERNVDED